MLWFILSQFARIYYLNQKFGDEKMNAKIYVLVVAVLVAAGTFLVVPAMAASVDQQLNAEVDLEIFSGTVVEVSDRTFVLDTGEGIFTVIVPGPQEEAITTFQELGLQAGDTVIVEGVIRNTSSGKHSGECDESLDITVEHLVAMNINGTAVFTPRSMDYHGSGMGNQHRRNQ